MYPFFIFLNFFLFSCKPYSKVLSKPPESRPSEIFLVSDDVVLFHYHTQKCTMCGVNCNSFCIHLSFLVFTLKLVLHSTALLQNYQARKLYFWCFFLIFWEPGQQKCTVFNVPVFLFFFNLFLIVLLALIQSLLQAPRIQPKSSLFCKCWCCGFSLTPSEMRFVRCKC